MTSISSCLVGQRSSEIHLGSRSHPSWPFEYIDFLVGALPTEVFPRIQIPRGGSAPTTAAQMGHSSARSPSPSDALLAAKYSLFVARGYLPTRESATQLLRVADKLCSCLPNPPFYTRDKNAVFERVQSSLYGVPGPEVVLGISHSADLHLHLASLYFCLHIARHSPLRNSAPKTFRRRYWRYLFGLGAGWLVCVWAGMRWLHTTTLRIPWGATLWDPNLETEGLWTKSLSIVAPLALAPVIALHEACKRFAGHVFPFLKYRVYEADDEVFFVRVDR